LAVRLAEDDWAGCEREPGGVGLAIGRDERGRRLPGRPEDTP